MDTKKFYKKLLAVLLTALIFISMFPMTAFAETMSVTGTSSWLNNYKYNFSGYTFAGGWHTGAYGTYQNLKANGNVAYCVEPGKSLTAGTKTVNTAWSGLTSTQRSQITAAFIYGYNGTTQWANADTEYVATQAIIWAIAIGAFNNSYENNLLAAAFKGTSDAAKQTAITVYSYIKNQIITHQTKPSFNGQTVTLRYNSSTGKYEGTLTDTNGVLSGYTYSCSGLTFSKNGNTLEVTSNSYFSNTLTASGKRTSNTLKNSLPSLTACYLTGVDQTTTTALNREDPVQTTVFVRAEGQGTAKINKVSEKSGAALNVGFRITGNGVDKTVYTNTAVDSNNAYVLAENLAPGTYTVTEIVPQNYYYASHASQTVTVTAGGTANVYFGNYLKRGSIEVKKVSSDNNNLEGWKFRVRGTSDSGEAVNFTLTTDANGVAKRENVLVGTYVVEETNCPSYMIQPASQSVSVEYNGTASVSFTNEYKKGTIILSKTDFETGDEIVENDGIFELSTWNNTTNQYEKVGELQYATMLNADKYGVTEGYIASNLPITETNEGKYKVEETKAPTGYALGENVFEVVITDDGDIVNVNDGSVTNKIQKGAILVFKKDADKHLPVAGAIYELRARNAIYANGAEKYKAGQVVATAESDAAGKMVFPDLYLGEYYYVEKSAPDGFVKDNTHHNVALSYNAAAMEKISVEKDTFDSVQKATITVKKYDTDTNDLIIAPAKYNIYANEDIYVNGVLEHHKDDLIDSITTSNGVGTSKKLYLGSYYVVEATAPEGYNKNNNKYFVTLIYKGEDISVYNFDIEDYDVPQYGRIKLQKVDENSKLIKDATTAFEIYAKEDVVANGKVIYTANELVDTIYTTNGVATIGQLNLGKYYAIEKEAPYGYIRNAAKYDLTLSYDSTKESVSATKTVANTSQQGTITVLKSDSETGTNIKDAVFEIKAAEDIVLNGVTIFNKNSVVDTLTTDANGKAISSKLPLGNYTVCEKTAPKPFTRNKTVYSVVLAYQGQEIETFNETVQITETAQKAKIHLHKVDSETQKALANAVFEIYADEQISVNGYVHYEKDELVDTVTTDSEGNATSKALYVGKYRIVEKTAPYGYVLNPDIRTVILEYIGQEVDIHTQSYTAENAPQLANIKVIKTDAETNKALKNAVYDVYVAEDVVLNGDIKYTADTLVDTITTDSNGEATTRDLYLGKYYLIENTAPYGYILDETRTDVTLEYKGQTVEKFTETAKLTNKAQKGVIAVYKYGEVFSSVSYADGYYQPVYEVKPLKNAIYDIFADEDIYTGDGTLRYTKDTLVDTVTTGEDGKAESKALYLGKYRVIENTAPDTMTYNGTPQYVELTYGGQSVELVNENTSFTNERQTVTFVIDKVMENDDLFEIGGKGEVRNVCFGLFAAEDLVADDNTIIPKDGLIEIAECDENGKVVFNSDVPVGKYYAKEMATDEHYIISENTFALNYEYAGQYVLTVEIKANDGAPIENTLIRGNILGKKVNDDGNPVVGATMGLFNVTDAECSELTALKIAETDENGEFLFENVPYGDYVVKELKAPEGYVLNDAATPVSVTENDSVVEIKVLNSIIKGTVVLTKVDAEYTENKLIGAEFEVYIDSNANGEFDEEIDQLYGIMEDKGNGTYSMSELRYNGYFVHESKAPEGFLLDEGYYYFEIRNDGETVIVENEAGKGCFINQPIVGYIEITKIDIADGSLIPNAGFRICDADGNVVVEGRTDENGIAKFRLRYGKYTYEEFDAPSGYKLDESKYPFEIKEDGKIVKATATNERIPEPIFPKTGDAVRCVLPSIGCAVVFATLGLLITRKKKEEEK